MESKLLKFSLTCMVGVFVMATNPKTALAFEQGVAGFTYDKISINSDNDSSFVTSLSLSNIPVPGLTNIGIANVDTNLIVRSGPGENEKMLGKLPKNGQCDILEADTGTGWTKITSGKVTGYVKTDYLITGEKASILALEVGAFVATANVNGLRVRKEPSTNADVLDQIAKGEELLVLEELVANYYDENKKWVKVSLDSEDSADGTVGYVAKEYVDLSYQLKKAQSIEELEFGTGVSSTRMKLVNKAKQYLGDRYVWGGTTLGKGVDCSGYTQQLYKLFGYSIPRTSRAQATGGTKISASSLKPGDLVFYGSGSYINHVAMFVGNGKVIHASNRRDGIKISNMYYRQPLKYVRYIKN